MQAPSTPAQPGESLTQASSTHTPTPTRRVPSLSELEDLLYDLLDGTGADPTLATDKLDLIQGFLHEHARERKSHAHFVMFFEKHGLPMHAEQPHRLTLQNLDLRDAISEAPPVAPLPERRDLTALTDATPTPYRSAAPAAKSRKLGWAFLWVLGFASLTGLLALAIVSFLALRTELTTLRREVRQSEQRLEQLQTEAEGLRTIVH
ncbi:MAG: hypothetical protein ABW321_04015, partial [Polyangiales bacterium]